MNARQRRKLKRKLTKPLTIGGIKRAHFPFWGNKRIAGELGSSLDDYQRYILRTLEDPPMGGIRAAMLLKQKSP